MSVRVVATASRSDYLASLELAWAEHLAPRAPDAPTVISTFAGGGGSSLGYSMAGYRELLAVEWDDNAAATFRLNFPDVPLYHGDITKLSADECLKRAGIAPGDLDVFDGSPPCQGFSTAGKRQIDDPRNSLFREYVRLLRGIQPRAFVMENVSGMVKGKMKLVFAECLRELRASGYRVRARLLNAMYFGVPQSRDRMIFVGVRDDLGIEPSHPAPMTRPIPSGIAISGADRCPLGVPTASIRLIASRIKPGGDAGDHTSSGAGFSVVRLNPDRPSMTITKHLAGMSGILQPSGHSYLSESQIKRLAGFPDVYQLLGKPTERWARIGNSVPPLFMRAIARHVAGLIAPGR
jgi:DNA (cytosine-5)-methyltransferase 1